MTRGAHLCYVDRTMRAILIAGGFLGLLLACLSAWWPPATGQAQAVCPGFCLSAEPGATGATQLTVSWPGAGSGSTDTVGYILLRFGPGGTTGQQFGPGPGSHHEAASDLRVCFLLLPEVYAGSNSANSRSSVPICHIPGPGTPAPIRISVGVSGFCYFCPVNGDRVRFERLDALSPFAAAGVSPDARRNPARLGV